MFRRRLATFPARVSCPKPSRPNSVSVEETCRKCECCGEITAKGVECSFSRKDKEAS